MTPRTALFLLVFVSSAFFYQAGGWNQNSRFALVRAITNEHSLRIDPFQASTGDKAFFDGHYYSDKAPGVAFAATPAVLVARPILHAFGGDAESYGGIALLSYVSTVATSGLLTALAAVVLCGVCVSLGASESGGLFAGLAYGLASPMWPLATLFLGHAISAACLVIAFGAAVSIDAGRAGAARRVGVTIGMGAGWATVSEFPAAIPAAIIAMLAALLAWHRLERRDAIRLVATLTVGALACAALLMAYQYACFGSPFHIAYTSEQGFEGMQQGFFGVRTPTLARLWHILFGLYRGLLPLAPACALAPVGFARLYRRHPHSRSATMAAAAIAAYYVLLNASYEYWEGGWSYGPRHLSPAIPFLAIGLGELWTTASRAMRVLLGTLSAWAVALALVATATMAQPPAQYDRPLTDLLIPAFRDGDLSLNPQRFTDGGVNSGALRLHADPKAAWNLGMILGLDGLPSLVPLFAVWLSLVFSVSARARSRAGSSSTD